MVLGYSGTSLVYTCESQSNDAVVTGRRSHTQVPISAVSKATAAVITSTGHGLPISSRPQITISGATGTGWTAINGNFTATVIDADTFSIPVDSSAFGTLGGTVVFLTTAPRLTVAEWSVKRLVYDASSNLIWSGWQSGTRAYNQKCSDATSSTNNQQ
jgi:hypothetical protein